MGATGAKQDGRTSTTGDDGVWNEDNGFILVEEEKNGRRKEKYGGSGSR